MSWAARRKFLYAFGVFAFIFMGFFPFIVALLSRPATCFDRVQNQEETAIDLGGPCVARDPATLKPVSVLWTRSFKLLPGIYSAVAYIENPNIDTGSERLSYSLKLYDSAGVQVTERTGDVFLPPQTIVPVFESNIQTGNRIPVRASLTFVEGTAEWRRMKRYAEDMVIRDQKNTDMDTRPRVQAIVANVGLEHLRKMPVVAVVFDEAGNAVGGSRTLIDDIPAGASREVIFTWPAPFTSYVSRVDIIPLSVPDSIRRL